MGGPEWQFLQKFSTRENTRNHSPAGRGRTTAGQLTTPATVHGGLTVAVSWPSPVRPPARGTAGLRPGGVQFRRVWAPAGALPPQPANCSVASLSWLGDRRLQSESSAINLLPALSKGAGDSLFKHQSPHPRVTKGGAALCFQGPHGNGWALGGWGVVRREAGGAPARGRESVLC